MLLRSLFARIAPAQKRPHTRKLAWECLERRDMLSAGPPKVIGVEVASTSWTPAFVSFLQSSGMGTNGYSIPSGSSMQAATLPWINLNRIAIAFNQDVEVDASDLSISGINTTARSFVDFDYNIVQPDPEFPDQQLYIATWTLSSPIAKDRLRLDLDANGADPVQDLDGNNLDGEWTNNSSTFTSGNGTSGGDFEFAINVLPADIDNTGLVTYYDYYYVNALSGKSTTSQGYNALRDLDGSGSINSTDTAAVNSRMVHSLPSGTPPGASNDAPTSTGIPLTQISNVAIDVALSLWSRFADSESGGTGLTYSVQSNSNASLFDDVHINSSTGELILNAASTMSGRSRIVVRATDPGGIFVESTATIDVNRTNQAPVITQFQFSHVGGGLVLIEGTVTDADDDVSDFTMLLYGYYATRCGVDQNGHFEIAIYVTPGDWGYEYLHTLDAHLLQSNVVGDDVGLT